ncbi:MAG: hypothetical protein ACI4NM_08210 [Bullifex sp.]
MNNDDKVSLMTLSFFLGGTIGGVWETFWTLLTRHVLEWKSGVMYFPFTNPIYGFGALIITLYALKEKRVWMIYLFSVISCTLAEYFFSLAEEWIFGTVSWDYSAHFMNIQGRVNLLYSLFWGLLGIVFAKKLVPLIVSSVKKNGEFYQDITFILLLLYIPLLFFSAIGCFYAAYGSGTNEVLVRLFSDRVMTFFYPTRVMV